MFDNNIAEIEQREKKSLKRFRVRTEVNDYHFKHL